MSAITKNLISVSKFAMNNNVFFEFHCDKCLVKSHASFEVVLQRTVNKDGLYPFGSLPATPTSSATINTLARHFLPNKASTLKSYLYTMWHNRLGHPHHEVLKTILNLCNVNVPYKFTLDLCSSCCLGKVHKLPSSLSNSTYSNPFGLLFTYVWSSCTYDFYYRVQIFANLCWCMS